MCACFFVSSPVCTQLLVSASPAEESVSQFVTLLDRCLNHEAFTQRQRRRIASWKEQTQRIWSTLPSVAGSSNPPSARNGPPNPPVGQQKDARSFGRRWSNVAHYPGFYNGASDSSASGAFNQSSSYSLFPPRQPRVQSSPSRPLFQQGPSHNSYGQHNHGNSTENVRHKRLESNRIRESM